MSEAESAIIIAFATGLIVKFVDFLIARAQARPKENSDYRRELREDVRYWRGEAERAEKENDMLREEILSLRSEVLALKMKLAKECKPSCTNEG